VKGRAKKKREKSGDKEGRLAGKGRGQTEQNERKGWMER